MDKEELEKLAGDPKFIKGIYNYCDRWCERCLFTSRCLNFAVSNEHFADAEGLDMSNKRFWERLCGTFQITLDMLKETAEREGIDLDSIDFEQTAKEEELKDQLAENHECCRLARAYAAMVDDWFQSAEALFGQKGDQFDSERPIEMPRLTPVEEDVSFEDAVQVIRWYQHQLYVKLMRAVRGDLEERSESHNEFPKDSDGSAKVALVGIDRSISAWAEIRDRLPMGGGDILDLLKRLYRLRSKVEGAFPGARAFIRPGFDKIELSS